LSIECDVRKNLATNNHYIPIKYSTVGLLLEGHFVLCKVNGKGKLRLTLEQALKSQTGCRGILLHFNFGARLVVKTTTGPHYSEKTTPVPTVQVAGWAPEPVFSVRYELNLHLAYNVHSLAISSVPNFIESAVGDNGAEGFKVWLFSDY